MRRFNLLLTGVIVLASAVVLLGCSQAEPTPDHAPPHREAQPAAAPQPAAQPQATTPAAATPPDDQPPPPSEMAAKIAQLPEEKRPKIVALGDSITYGYQVYRWEAYPKQLERLLNDQGYPHLVLNAGVNKLDSDGGLTLLPRWLEQKPVMVIIELGINDSDPALIKANLAKMIKLSQDAGAKVVISGQEDSSTRKALYYELEKELKVTLIPDMRHGLEEIKGYLGDHVHCNPKGCLHMAEQNVLPVILPLLSKETQ